MKIKPLKIDKKTLKNIELIEWVKKSSIKLAKDETFNPKQIRTKTNERTT
jgi:hypothetical protein